MHRLAAFWVNLRSSLWFVPSVIVLASVILGLGLGEVGRIDALSQSSLPRFFGFSAEGSRAMLSAIASSMITVAGVAFSITIVALSLASTQYSPRVLRHFMRDRSNQTVLGVFVGIFSYCLVVLPIIRGGEEKGYVPALAVALGVVLALVGVGCLIHFIHHVATAIQASAIVAVIAEETHRAIEELFPESIGKESHSAPAELQHLHWTAVPAPASGMLQLVDDARLLKTAAGHDVVVRMECHIGDFIVRGMPLVSVSRAGPDDEAYTRSFTNLFTIKRTRTIEQDPAFGIRQIVDVALRALSPSLNDTTTAILCINYLADLLAQAAARSTESPYREYQGKLRVITTRVDFEEFVHLAFDQIRESGANNSVVLARLLWSIEIVGSKTQFPARRRLLAEAARSIGDVAQREIKSASSRHALLERAECLVRLYAVNPR